MKHFLHWQLHLSAVLGIIILALSAPLLYAEETQVSEESLQEQQNESRDFNVKNNLTPTFALTHGAHILRSQEKDGKSGNGISDYRHLKIPIDSTLISLNNDFSLWDRVHFVLKGARSLSHTAGNIKSEEFNRFADHNQGKGDQGQKDFLSSYKSRNNIWTLNAELNAVPFQYDFFTTFIGLGYSVQNFRHTFGNFNREYPSQEMEQHNEVVNLDSWYRVQYQIPYASVGTNFSFLKTFNSHSSFAYSPFARALEKENNIVRYEEGQAELKGSFWRAQTELTNQLGKHLSFHLGFSYTRISLQGDKKQNFNYRNQAPISTTYAERLANSQYQVQLGLAYIF